MIVSVWWWWVRYIIFKHIIVCNVHPIWWSGGAIPYLFLKIWTLDVTQLRNTP